MAVENTRLRVAKHRQLGRLAFFEGRPVSSPPLCPFVFAAATPATLFALRGWLRYFRGVHSAL